MESNENVDRHASEEDVAVIQVIWARTRVMAVREGGESAQIKETFHGAYEDWPAVGVRG